MRIIRYQDTHGHIGHAALQPDGSALKLHGDVYDNPEIASDAADVAKVLAPIQPTDIICIGLNYRRHAQETGATPPEYPVVFWKGVNTLQNPGDPIQIPRHLPSDEVDYECELAMVIGSACKNVPKEKALAHVLGYTCANDVSARDWQLKRGSGQWCRGKTFDTFSPMGPCLVTRDELTNPHGLGIRTRLNDQVMQDWRTDDMIFDIPTLIEFLSGSTTLLPGTIILTGTPHGVGMAQKPPRWLKPGDTVTIEIDQIGSLTSPVVFESV